MHTIVNRPLLCNLFLAYSHAAVLPELPAASDVCEVLFAGSSTASSSERTVSMTLTYRYGVC